MQEVVLLVEFKGGRTRVTNPLRGDQAAAGVCKVGDEGVFNNSLERLDVCLGGLRGEGVAIDSSMQINIRIRKRNLVVKKWKIRN